MERHYTYKKQMFFTVEILKKQNIFLVLKIVYV